MIIKLIPLLIVVFLIYLTVKRIRKLPTAEQKGALIKLTVYGVVGLLMLAVITGRLHWLGAVVAVGLGLIKFGFGALIRLLPVLKVLRSNNVFSDPVFRTEHIELTLNINTGAVSGRILSGEFTGKPLSELSVSDFDRIEIVFAKKDKRSLYLLRIARHRLQSQTHQNEQYHGDDTDISNPTHEEARLILGLDEEFTKKDVNTSYKRLIQKLHPDRGGNDYLASRINLARDLLLKTLNDADKR